jgi:ketosteroid isomerase-like protein
MLAWHVPYLRWTLKYFEAQLMGSTSLRLRRRLYFGPTLGLDITMKTLGLAALLAALVACSAASGSFIHAPSSDTAAQHEILKLLKERRDAFYRGDFDKFQDIEADDFTRISEDGSLLTKQEQVAYLRSRGEEKSTSDTHVVYSDHDVEINVHGAVAVLTGILSETGGSEAKPHIQQSRFTEVWVFRYGHWQTLHNHYTYISTDP